MQTELKDHLTGAYSRLSLDEWLHSEVERASRYDEVFSILLIDLDYFKSINDAFGHLRGDQVLVALVQRLRNAIRTSDLIFRYGGDEFVILLPHTGKDEAAQLAERLVEAARSRPFAGLPPVTLTMSIGVAAFPEDAQTPESLFKIADQRNYQAKRAGRSRVAAEESLHTGTVLFDEPDRLIERDEALAVFQSFLSSLAQARSGVLTVAGPEGAGKSRFLATVRENARVQGFTTLSFSGNAALKERVFGVIAEARRMWTGMPLPAAGFEPFVNYLKQLIQTANATGLLITLDNASETDPDSLAFLQNLMTSSGIENLALVYTTTHQHGETSLISLSPLHMRIQLGPLSEEGLRVWLRYSLQWEAPAAFHNWLYLQTHGWPGLIWRSLNYLVEQEVIYPETGGWFCRPDFASERLSDLLAVPELQPPHSLPRALTRFVGREDEILTLKQMLKEHALISITGLGGVGKTRLAVQVAFESLAAFPDGVFFVPLGQQSAPDFLVTAISDALKLSFSGKQKPRTYLTSYLSRKQILLVLDGFEERLKNSEFLEELLLAAPGLRVLVTSAQKLDVPDEKELLLRGLPYPAAADDENLMSYGAVQLFLRAACQACSSFEILDYDREAVVEICNLVEGIPLGLELAAAWVQSLSCQEIAFELRRSMGGVSDTEPAAQYHHSLNAVFNSFWQMLSPSEQSVLGQLSVFRGGFSREAAGKIAGASPFFLEALVAKAHLRRLRLPQERFEIQELLRRFLAEKLHAMPAEEEKAGRIHATSYAAFLQKRENELLGRRQVADEIRLELDNLRTAWNWAVRNEDIGIFSQMALGLSRFYLLTGLYQEGVQVFQQAIQALAGRPSDPETDLILGMLLAHESNLLDYLGLYGETVGIASSAVEKSAARPCAQAFALLQLGRAQHGLGEYDVAAQSLVKALTLSRNDDEACVKAEILNELGDIALTRGKSEEASECYHAALALYRQMNDLRGEGSVLANLSTISQNQGRSEEARSYCEQALSTLHEIGDRRGECHTLSLLGNILQDMQAFQQARACLEEALSIYREIGDRAGECWGLNTLGYSLLIHRALDEARSHFELALQISLQIGDQWSRSISYNNLGSVYMVMGDYGRALTALQNALQTSRDIGDAWGEAWRLTSLGQLFNYLGENETALAHSQKALQLARTLVDKKNQLLALIINGHACTALGELEQAGEHFTAACQLADALKLPALKADALAGLARLALMNGQVDQAANLVAAVRDIVKNNSLRGLFMPYRVHLIVYQVLQAAGDFAGAAEVLDQAHAALQKEAAAIGDRLLRRSFLENVSDHCQIMAVWTAAHPPETVNA